jgi:hypothetical protein
VKRASSRKRSSKPPTPDQIRRHIARLVDAHQIEWHHELISHPGPNWSRLLSLHLQMVELEGIEAGMQEFSQ